MFELLCISIEVSIVKIQELTKKNKAISVEPKREKKVRTKKSV
jgi:hypothetical protein